MGWPSNNNSNAVSELDFMARPLKEATSPGKSGKIIRSVTLTDVAALAGVSAMTASRALRNPGIVSKKTRDLVFKAVDETGYIPNLLAGSLRSNRSRMIACLVPTIASGSAFLLALHAMTAVFVEAGYQVMLGERGYDKSRDSSLLDAVIARRPDGIVLTGVMQSPLPRKRLKASRIPVVETWEMTNSPIDMLVGFSHHEVGREVARYFHAQGHKNVASIASSELRTGARFQGFLEEALRLGIAGKDLRNGTYLTVDSPSRLLHGRQGLTHILKQQKSADAIYCPTDMVAVGTLMEAQLRRIRVPQDLAVVGFGDFDFAEDVVPSLTTVRVDSADIGKRTAEMLIARIEGRPIGKRVQDVGFTIVQRQSG
jgi:LacI family gluconate utilization system Gnt-I transcriptional repressor